MEQKKLKHWINPNAKNVTQEMITSGNADYKKHEPMIARWVNLYNVYCNKGSFGRQSTAIPLEMIKTLITDGINS